MASPATHLNVGCGSELRPDWTNADLWAPQKRTKEPFVKMDASERPWPFEENRFERIYAGCVLPHMPTSPTKGGEDPLHVFITEAFRVLRPGGVLEADAPDPRDPMRALGRVHHYRLIHPEMFQGYLRRGEEGIKYAAGGPFTSLRFDWGYWGAKKEDRSDARGRPLGVSRLLPNLMPLGMSKLGALTHLFRRLHLRFLLRGEKVRVLLTK